MAEDGELAEAASDDARAARIAARRREVESQLREVEGQLAELRAARGALHDDDEHDPDGVSLSSEWSRLEGLRREEAAALDALDEAAARLARGEGGTCATCGRPIDPARLEARPGATSCIACAA
ncbi:TraR/DksA C4-type zinc finger protein [Agrococcus sp. SL85]|uniref:TraR/DksA family transcriptional regulator n=1 Tax=Agrococcus sp. SL85 TaxID=2995141 RepID=UPI00226CE855|nr:TraR/DksA C4-type zinc finger protein [Agrococcus sp. SL85]WAC65439.1 TraR/DksA C4-type zinc finger protein [Agrococcus sp. SL85]